MKLVIFLASVLGSGFAWADACPNLNGTYIANDGVPVRYLQNDCATLTRKSAPQWVNGNTVFTVSRVFSLDGTPFCAEPGKQCESARIDDDQIVFSFHFEPRRTTSEHGICTTRETAVKKESDGNLTYTLKLSDCADGFSGDLTRLYVPYEI